MQDKHVLAASLMLAVAGMFIGTSAAVAGTAVLPDIFREAAQTPGGVLAYVSGLEDEAFRTGDRAPVDARRWTVQGMIFQIDRYRDKEQLLANLPDWLLPPSERGKLGANRGVNAAANDAYAEMLDSAARLYDRPDLAARAAFMREQLHQKGLAVATAPSPSSAVTSTALPSRADLAARVREELTPEIRPGGVDGQLFWNGNAQMFMYPPSFEFAKVPGAVRYRFQVMDDQQYAHIFEAETPTASLKPVWAFVPRGLTAVFCFGLGADGKVCGLAGERRFWKQVPYEPGVYPPAKRPYAQAQRMLCDYILNLPEIADLEKNGKPDLSARSNFSSYPSKMQSAVIRAMLSLSKIAPERKERALKVARIAADYLLARSQPVGTPLEYFTPTYEGDGQLSGTYAGMHMLIYPADAGTAFVNLSRATGEVKYLDAAKRIAATYRRLQGEDGTWYLKMNEKDGSPVSGNRLVPTSVIFFFEALYAATGEAAYRAVADRAFGFIDNGPLKTWNWEGQFEDIRPAESRFQNLTKHNACDTAIYMLKRFPGDKRRLAQAREIVRYAEDQFVVWRQPCRADRAGYKRVQTYPYETWMTPVALEQYNCYFPIDGSVAKLIRTWLALWEAERNPLDLAKARSLGDATVNMQEPSGRVRTYWVPEPGDGTPIGKIARQPAGGDWLGCLQADEWALGLLAGTEAVRFGSSSASGGDTLHAGFVSPPASARPHVWWHWMNGHVTRAGITADLEAMAKAGIGGAQIFDVSDGIPEGEVPFASEAWYDLLAYANDEAKRLGIELALSNCSGWSSSGGPWVRPEDSMKRIVYSETVLRGGERFCGALPQPDAVCGFYRDVATLAFPRPAGETVDLADYGLRSSFKAGDCRAELRFDRPFPLTGLSIDFAVEVRHTDALVTVAVSEDGKTFRDVVAGMTVYPARFGDRDDAVFVPVDAGDVRAVKVTVDLTAATAWPGTVDEGVKTVRPASAKGLESAVQRVVAIRPEARMRIPEFRAKTFSFRSRLHGYPYAPKAGQAIDPARIVNLTDRLGADGSLDWTAPAGGDWIIARFGFTSTGAGPRPATKAGAGLEVDKLSKEALSRFFAGYVDKVLVRLGPVSPTGGLNNVLVDSFEVGCQNWTDGLDRLFKERFGYDLVPWLPLFGNRVVGSAAGAERVLADFRRLVSDLFVENYAGEFQRLCRARGLLFSLEGYGNAPCDDLRYARWCDVPMGEFWAGNASAKSPAARLGGVGNSRFPGFISHVWGQRFVGAEAFTSAQGERWDRDPFAYKAQGDRVFCMGVNRVIYHRWAHQPWTNPANEPGMTMGPHGSHFERTQTWWNDAAPAWLRYQSRCQWMLQEGVAAADVLVFAGDAAPSYGLDLSRWHDHALLGENVLGAGRQWDVCGGEAILASRAEGGEVVVPSGARYKAVALLSHAVPERDVKSALDAFAAQGVPVVPVGVVDETLRGRGIAPDFICRTPSCARDVRWIHRLAPDGSDVYFVALPNEKAVSVDVSFRVAGRVPEIWEPETGAVCVPRIWKASEGRTDVQLDFAPSGAAFVVFRPKRTEGIRAAEAPLASERTVAVDGPWTVEFLDGRGAPSDPVAFETLTPWNERSEDGIRFYSGSAVYRRQVEDPRRGKNERVVLDLGTVKNVAVVTVNGKTFPVLWKPPFTVDITDALVSSLSPLTSHPSPLTLQIKVTNLWPNRLIGDDALPCDAEYGKDGGIVAIPSRLYEGQPSPCGRHTFTTWRLWTKKDALLPSGLIGPVRLGVTSSSDLDRK